jgi:hypothetical protein
LFNRSVFQRSVTHFRAACARWQTKPLQWRLEFAYCTCVQIITIKWLHCFGSSVHLQNLVKIKVFLYFV